MLVMLDGIVHCGNWKEIDKEKKIWQAYFSALWYNSVL